MDLGTLIRQVPAWRGAGAIRHEPLSGGYSNVVHKVTVDGRAYALRINGDQNRYLGLDFAEEVAVMRLAAAHGLAPAVLEAGDGANVLISDFIDGRTLTVADAHDAGTLARITDLLKRVHQLPYTGPRTSTPFSLTRGYLRGIADLGLACPADLRGFMAEMDRIEAERQTDPGFMRHTCHNDPFTHNLLEDGAGKLQLIDWELSGRGDIWFDLATVSFSCGLDTAADDALLKTYFGAVDDARLRTLHDMKFVCMIREIGWALLHTALEQNRPDPGPGYLGFAYSVLDRLKRGLVSLV